MQEGHPIAYFSKKLGQRMRLTSTYNKELHAIAETVQKWRQYLLGKYFIIQTDQKSIQELLMQTIHTPEQQVHIRKLLGYDFRIEYKAGINNKAADALSRRDADADFENEMGVQICFLASIPVTQFLDEVAKEMKLLKKIES